MVMEADVAIITEWCSYLALYSVFLWRQCSPTLSFCSKHIFSIYAYNGELLMTITRNKTCSIFQVDTDSFNLIYNTRTFFQNNHKNAAQLMVSFGKGQSGKFTHYAWSICQSILNHYKQTLTLLNSFVTQRHFRNNYKMAAHHSGKGSLGDSPLWSYLLSDVNCLNVWSHCLVLMWPEDKVL